jgi:hypothetical protein
MAGSREHGNEISGSIKDGEFLVHLTYQQLPKNGRGITSNLNHNLSYQRVMFALFQQM